MNAAGVRVTARAQELSAMQRADLEARVEWWWDEAATCERIGAHGLAEFCRRQATTLQEQLA